MITTTTTLLFSEKEKNSREFTMQVVKFLFYMIRVELTITTTSYLLKFSFNAVVIYTYKLLS